MARVEGQITIRRPVGAVFDYVADPTNEPQYNANMVRAAKISAGPIGKGSRFCSAVGPAGHTVDMVTEFTAYDRPSRLASTTTLKWADIDYELVFEPTITGTRMRWSGRVRPKGALRLLGPLIGWLGSRQEQRIWQNMKNHLEGVPVAGK
jgi:uncharacterized protein YndB with AHSA1/START domain